MNSRPRTLRDTGDWSTKGRGNVTSRDKRLVAGTSHEVPTGISSNSRTMIIPGRAVMARQIVCGVLSSKNQIQPCGIDLSLKRVLRWTSAGAVDFDNVHRKTSTTTEIPFQKVAIANAQANQTDESLHLAPGAYLIEFNETVDTPLDAMGQLFVRSSLFRSGALVSAGVMDAGYKGAIGEVNVPLYQTM
jgi:deoxycytidine triphosphate deaminase